MMLAIVFFLAGVLALAVGDRVVYYWNRYRLYSGSSRFKCGWKPPLGCVLFDHKFKRTEFGITLVEGFLKTALEVCDRCEMGRMLTLQGPSYETPATVREILKRATAVEVGRVVPFEKSTPGTSSRPLPPSA